MAKPHKSLRADTSSCRAFFHDWSASYTDRCAAESSNEHVCRFEFDSWWTFRIWKLMDIRTHFVPHLKCLNCISDHSQKSVTRWSKNRRKQRGSASRCIPFRSFCTSCCYAQCTEYVGSGGLRRLVLHFVLHNTIRSYSFSANVNQMILNDAFVIQTRHWRFSYSFFQITPPPIIFKYCFVFYEVWFE